MHELETKHKIRRITYSIPVIIFLLILVSVFARGAWKAVEKERISAGKVEGLRGQSEDLENRQVELEQAINRLDTEEGIREELRSKFNVFTEGEHFAILIDPAEGLNATNTQPRTWYKKWWNGLKDLWR